MTIEEADGLPTEALGLKWAAPYLRDSGGGCYHGTPLIGPTVSDVVSRVSIATPEWRDSEYPVFIRHLGQGSDAGTIEQAVAACGLAIDGNYRIARATSRKPVNDGFLTCLRFTRVEGESAPQGATIGQIAVAFFASERSRLGRNVTSHVVELYRDAEPSVLDHPALRLIDFPCFDMGTLGLGFGMLICRHVWLWSRCEYYHK